MTITVLAVAFLVIVLALALFGFKVVIRQGKAPEEANKERCSVCRTQLLKSQLVERQVGDYRLLYFCPACITSLYHELTTKN